MLATTMMGGAAIFALAALPMVAIVAAPTEALAQAQTGSLRIAVTGDDGAPLSGATVSVSSPDSLVSRSGVTDSEGRVRLAGLDPATNYTVQVSAPGYADFSASNVAVVTNRDLSLGYILTGESASASNLDDIIVTGTSLAAIDVTSATVGTTLTLDVVEALPTGRSYQSYLQLVPGTKPSVGGNPSSRSGTNVTDNGGTVGSSRDNVYYLDGVDVTDPTTGTFGANFNSEIIQEQQVIVGGVPAEYAGGAGLISRVVTKSGSNDWHGSLNYYFQNSDLVAEDENVNSGGFDTYDTAFTLGGPILRDRLWIFGSYQQKHRETEVLDPATGAVRRTVTNDADYGFAKLTWQLNDNHRLTASYFNDPTEISGSTAVTTLNNRDFAQLQGGDNYKVEYNGTFGNLLINAYGFSHEGELSNIAADTSIRDTVAFRTSAGATLQQRNLGGSGVNTITNRNREEYGLNAEYFLDTGFGSHTIKAGYINSTHTYNENSTVPGGVTYSSLAPIYSGTTLQQYYTATGTGVDPFTTRAIVAGDLGRLATAIQGNAAARAAVDTNSDGTISTTEVQNYRFTSTAGSPYGNINVYRAIRTASGEYDVTSEGQTFYLQDTWTLGQLTVNAGVRVEQWEHFASTGEKTATFEWEYAPRLSVVYDVFGDARTKVFGFAGRYYDPARNNFSDFAGALTGPVDDEQIFVGGQWVTFRTRGGTTTPDAIFSPSTKTPYTDEFMIGASTTIGSSIGVSGTIVRRQTRDLFEDFDLALYADPNATAASGAAGVAYPGSAFYLGLPYFGYSTTPNANYVIGTLPGGERNYTGFELVVTKYKTDNWLGQMSYTYNDAEGNTNSDGDADFAGDVVYLDPRAPNLYGPQAGNIEHQFKAYAAYDFSFPLQISGVFNWNSGLVYTPAVLSSGRLLPVPGPASTVGGVTDSFLLPGTIGSETAPSYYTFDMRFKYVQDLRIGEAEFFLDIFNVFNRQVATGVQRNTAGDGVYAYQQANAWVAPRQLYLGVRYSF